MISGGELERLREALRTPAREAFRTSAREPLLRAPEKGAPDLAPWSILRAVARFYRVDPAALIGNAGGSHLKSARYLAMYLMRKMALRSYPAIAHFFQCTHSTAIRACRLTEARCAAAAPFAGAVEEVAKHAIAEIRGEENHADETDCAECNAGAAHARDGAA